MVQVNSTNQSETVAANQKSIIDSYSENFPILNSIFHQADAMGNNNGKIDTDVERNEVNRLQKENKKLLEKEGVTIKWCNDHCTSIDFKTDDITYHLGFNGGGHVSQLIAHKKNGKPVTKEALAKFFGLTKLEKTYTTLEEIKIRLGLAKREESKKYQDQNGSILELYAEDRDTVTFWNEKFVPGRLHY